MTTPLVSGSVGLSPTTSRPCPDCGEPINRNHRAVRCGVCAIVRARKGERSRDKSKKRENAARYRERHREELAAKQAIYIKSHPEVALLGIHRRRARKNGTVRAQEWRDKRKFYGGLCAYCLSAPGVTMDHVVPLAKGGPHHIDNIVPACDSCNKRKGTQEWRPNVGRGFVPKRDT